MTRRIRLTPATSAVLDALAEDPRRWRHGYDLLAPTGLKSGSLYPILIRLGDRGLLEAVWERDAPPGRPPRHLYRLTAAGLELAREVREMDLARSSALRPRLRGAQ
jgi:PadR family transcriptional regulator, regulatory protein PadR